MQKYCFKIIIQPVARFYWRLFKPKTYGSRAILVCGDEIMLVKNSGANHFTLPGGKIDKWETPEECVLRELKEELNITGDIKYQLGTYVSSKEGKRDTVHIFVVNTDAKNFKTQYELDDARWFKFTDLPQDLGPAATRRIKEFQSGERGVRGVW